MGTRRLREKGDGAVAPPVKAGAVRFLPRPSGRGNRPAASAFQLPIANRQSAMLFILLGSVCAWLASTVSALSAETPADPFTLAITAEDLDLEACATWHDGKQKAVNAEKMKQALGLVKVHGKIDKWHHPWSAGQAGLEASRYGRANPQAEVFHYRIAFKAAVGIGAVLCSNGEVRVLKEEAPYPGDPAVAEHWTRVAIPPFQRRAKMVPLPVGLKTRAVLLTDRLKRGRSMAWPARLYARRLFNVAPDAAVAAKSQYQAPTNFGGRLHAAADVVRGRGPWESNGKDDRGEVRGPFISDVQPCWYALAWEETRPIVGLVSVDNFVTLHCESYRGPEAGNPLIGTEKEWARVKSRFRGGQDVHVRSDHGRWTRFKEPVETRGLRLKILKAWQRVSGGTTDETQVASLDCLQVLVDLGEAPVPETAQAGPPKPPFRIPYELAASGTFTLAVDDADGKRVRNLVARVLREAGAQEERWDLKGADGKFVAPGTYRWKAITGPELSLSYEQTVYPNVQTLFPESVPWLTGRAGAGGWLADHSPPFGGCAGGEYTFFCAPTPESGVGFAACDLQGKKLWGIDSFGAWTGGNRLASDGKKVYVESFGWHESDAGADRVWEVDVESHAVTEVFRAKTDERRARGCKGIAVRGGKVYLAINARQKWIANPVGLGAVDIERCLPYYEEARRPKYPYEIVPNPRHDFLRLFRFTGSPPGYGKDHGLTFLESTKGPGRRQHIVLAFKKPVQLGSCIYPVPQGADYKVKLSALKAGAPYPPDPDRQEDWLPFERNGALAWDIGLAPPGLATRALRITFQTGEDDELADVMDEMEVGGEGGLDMGGGGVDLGLGGKKAWRGRLEGMKLLRRRYRNLFGSAEIRVTSGQVKENGTWEAVRDKPLSKSDPEVYLMTWKAVQKVRGLAIKEIDCSLTEVDVWTGPAGSTPSLEGTTHWEMVGRYIPRRRMQHVNFAGHNADARYMDGVVDFGRDVETRAIRLRVVEQWTVRTREGSCAKGGLGLDPSRARLFGVAPLEYLGGEVPVESLMTERLEVLDPATKTIEKEIAIDKPGDLDFDPAGNLYALSAGTLVKVDLEGGAHAVLADDLEKPTSIAVDGEGQIYVFDAAPGRKVIRVYGANGTHRRDIGTPGGYRAGPWDPMRFEALSSMAVDREGKLWVVDRSYWPKRVACFQTDGTHVRDILGPTAYGGGGVLDPHDKTRLVYGPLEFELDWEQGTSRLKNLLTVHGWGNALSGGWQSLSGEVHIRLQGRDYYVTRPQGPSFNRPVGAVYLYEKDRLRPVAAMGHASQFAPFKRQEVIDSLGGKLLAQLEFIWTDRSGDGVVDVDEVAFSPKTAWPLTRFNEDLGVQAGHFRFVVDEFLPNGVPVYKKIKTPMASRGGYTRGGVFRFDDGSYYRLGDEFPDAGFTADGEQIWTYPNEGIGVGPDRSCKPFSTDQVVCQFVMVGHETAVGGDLGEFFVTNANLGSWYVWTRDGLLATRIFRDLRDGERVPWSMEENDRGLDLSDVTAGQEHFSGWFCRSRQDDKYYAVAGHHWAGVVEVEGLDAFKRLGGSLTVTPEDIAAAMAWEKETARYRAKDRLKVYDCYRAERSPLPRGKLSDWDDVQKVSIADGIRFAMSYDEEHLYLYYNVMGKTELVNSGEQWRKAFKTGSCVDIMLGLDPEAEAGRRAPVEGDLRLLFTRMAGKPVTVLYNAVKPGTPEDERWQVVSPVARVEFDEVRRLDEAVVRYTRHTPRDSDAFQGFTLDAAVPLAALGLAPAPKLRLKFDWGYLESDAKGTQVLRRRYWSNQATSTVADAPSEARLEPDLWGWVRFHGKAAGRGGELDPGDLLGGSDEELDPQDVLDELEED